MSAVVALDLDQTLVYSVRSAGPLDGVSTVWVEDYQDAPLSLMTTATHQALRELATRHHVLPVTTRTPDQYARIRLPMTVPTAVCANGGVLLRHGVRDAAWDRRVHSDLRGYAPAASVSAHLDNVSSSQWVKTRRQVEDLFVYLVAHSREQVPDGWAEELEAWAAPLGWGVSVQGRKAYVVPHGLSKGAAALRLAQELGGPLLAAGDSELDRSLLEVALVAARPAHGELHRSGYAPPGLFVTTRSGARAAEDLLAHLSHRADTVTAESDPTL